MTLNGSFFITYNRTSLPLAGEGRNNKKGNPMDRTPRVLTFELDPEHIDVLDQLSCEHSTTRVGVLRMLLNGTALVAPASLEAFNSYVLVGELLKRLAQQDAFTLNAVQLLVEGANHLKGKGDTT